MVALNDLLYTTIVIVSAISLLGTAFIITMYHRHRSLQVLAFKLVYILTIFDGIRSVFSMIPTNLDLSDGGALCITQGFALQFSSLAGVVWTGAIAMILYLKVLIQKDISETHYRPMLWFTVGFSMVCTIIPLTSLDYAYVGGWCWISTSSIKADIYRYALFYFWVWVVILFDIYAYVKVILKVKKESTIKDSFLHEGRVLVNRLRLYPMILVICFTPLTITRIMQTISDDTPVWLLIFSTATSNLLGFFNAVLYGFNDSVRSELRNWVDSIGGEGTSFLRLSKSSMDTPSSSDLE